MSSTKFNAINFAYINQVGTEDGLLASGAYEYDNSYFVDAVDTFVDKFLDNNVSLLRVREARKLIGAMCISLRTQSNAIDEEIKALKKFGTGVDVAVKERRETVIALENDRCTLSRVNSILHNWEVAHMPNDEEDDELI